MHALTQMKLLVNLAQVDGEVAGKEKTYIMNIGQANGISSSQVQTLLQQEHAVIVPDNLSADQKFDYIYSLVQLMKIDEKMYQEEIRFCSAIAAKLGYDQEVLFDLMLHVKSSSNTEKEIKQLKELTARHLKK